MTTTQFKIRLYGDPCLREKSKPVKEVGPAERMLIASMIKEVQENENDVGLAAPQIGVNEQVLVADIGSGPVIMVNPRIIAKEGSDVMEEGCLSFPGVYIKIKRPKRITVRYKNENNNVCEDIYDNFLARVIQHEIDHIKGKLIIDYANWRERRKFKNKLIEIQKQSKNI